MEHITLLIMARCLVGKGLASWFVLALEGVRNLVRWLACRDCLFPDLEPEKVRTVSAC
ncbi:MAG: hypothetical protein Ct9H300mP25_10920 [Acidobacteriota bacterium]|nr:MAG: hypothetical protein Ct9H300mP25_10920 [Acidobacteriota bacterium]